MSAIGDYVHYRASNYNLYGIAKRGSDASQSGYDFNNYISTISKRALNLNNGARLSKIDKINMAAQIQSLFNPHGKTTADTAQVSQVKTWVEDALRIEFQDSLGNIEDFWRTGVIKSTKSSQGKLATISSKSYIKETTLNAIINELNALLSYFQGSSSMKKEANGLKNDLQKINSAIENFRNYIDTHANGKCKIGNRYFDAKKVLPTGQLKTLSAGGQYRNIDIIGLINKTIQTYASIPNFNLQKGTGFEEATMMVLNGISADAKQAAIDGNKTAIKNLRVGASTGDVKINADFFADGLMEQEIAQQKTKSKGTKTIILGENITEKIYSTQGKTDIIIDWVNPDTGVRVQAPASLKNTGSMTSYLHLVSGTSLLYLLQDESPTMVNHYLNLTAWHPSDGKAGISLSQKNAALNTIKCILAYKALTGDTYGREAASVFIVNRGGIIFIADMADMITTILDRIITGDGSAIDTYFYFKGELNDFVNNFASSAEARIAKLLADVHSRKISVAFKPAVNNLMLSVL